MVVPLELQGYTEKSVGPFYQELAQRLESVPGIQSVSVARSLPLLDGPSSFPAGQIENYAPQKDEFIVVEFAEVGPKYFETMGIPVVQTPEMGVQQSGSLVWVNESFVRRYWPGQNPIGKRVGPFVVNGVVKDSQIKNLTDRPGPYLYRQSAEPRSTSLTLIVKTDGNSRAAMAAVRREILRDNKDLDLSRMRTMRQILI